MIGAKMIGAKKSEKFGIRLCQTVLITHKLKKTISDRSSPLSYPTTAMTVMI